MISSVTGSKHSRGRVRGGTLVARDCAARLDLPDDQLDFDVLFELRERGGTDYLALPIAGVQRSLPTGPAASRRTRSTIWRGGAVKLSEVRLGGGIEVGVSAPNDDASKPDLCRLSLSC